MPFLDLTSGICRTRTAGAFDPIMQWAKNARNTIEKQGDLKTHSQVRAMINVGYFGGPETDWMPEALFASPYQIYKAVPKKYLIPHVIENGTVVIERRWIENSLPSMEILEALAHVYEQLAESLIDLFKHLNLSVPPVITESRPDAMGALAMDRALYLSMKDGSPHGLRFFEETSIFLRRILR